MSPLRILVLVILFYIGYRLIVGTRKKPAGTTRKQEPPQEMPASDILVEDPVCNKLVPRTQAVKLETAGQTHYFCSKTCCDIYRNQHGDQQ